MNDGCNTDNDDGSTPHRFDLLNDRLPTLAIVVQVHEVFLHCAKAFRRSQLWDPAARQDRKAMPSLLNMILDQTTGAPADPDEMRRIDEGLEQDYKTSMY